MTSPFPGQSVKSDTADICRSLPKQGQRYGFSETFLRKRIHAGTGPVHIKVGNRFHVRDSDMDAWVDAMRNA